MRRSAPAVVVLACLLAPASAWAHAELMSTAPAKNAVLKTEPKVVTFTFGESVIGQPDSVRVYDSAGARVDQGDAGHTGGDPKVYGVALKPGLKPGTYTATYRIVSADTHVVTGGMSFSIGAPSASGGASVDELLQGQKTGPVSSWAFTITRAVQYAAIAIGVGVFAFLLAVWLPAVRGRAGAITAEEVALARARVVIRAAAGVGLVSALLGIAFEAAESAGVSLWHAPVGHVLGTRFGVVWLIAALLWLVTLVAAPAVLRAPGRLVWLAVPLAVLVALPALAGHAGVEHPVWLFLPTNIIHVAAMTAWTGGLVALIFVVPVASRQLAGAGRTELLARAVGRFSPLALGCVIALLATGIVQSLVNINAWVELTQTAYGRAVLIKIGLLAVLIALGAQNRQRTVPRLKQLARAGAAAGAAGLVLRRALQAEVSVLAGVIVVSGALSAYTPAKDAYVPMATVNARLGPSKLQLTLMPA
jgi:copper transport protein